MMKNGMVAVVVGIVGLVLCNAQAMVHNMAHLGHSFTLDGKIQYVRHMDLAFACVHVRKTPKPFALIQVVRPYTMASLNSEAASLSAESSRLQPSDEARFIADRAYLKRLFELGTNMVQELLPGIQKLYVLIETDATQQDAHLMSLYDVYCAEAYTLASRAYQAGLDVYWIPVGAEHLCAIIDLICRKHKWGPELDACQQARLGMFYYKKGEMPPLPAFAKHEQTEHQNIPTWCTIQ